MLDIIRQWDEDVLYLVNTYCKNKFFDRIMPIITYLGNMGILWLTLGVLMIYEKDYRIVGIKVIVTLVFTTIIGEGIVKHIVRRKRPFKSYKERKLLINKPRSFSFPSGHTASSFSVAVVFLRSNSSISTTIVLIAISIAFSRIYLNVHYPSDVVGGVILGIICGSFIVNNLII